MRWLTVVAVLALFTSLPAPSVAQKKARNPNIVESPPLSPEEQLKKFHLPPGFIIQLVAAEPKIKKPINIAFDAQGRLWVTGSEEYPFPAPADRKGKDAVKVLEDFDADGRARKVTTFADGLNIPIGILPVPGGALVYSIPHIHFLHDAGGVAGKREILYSQFGFKDTHGMTGEFMRGFDGWVYCCHGFSNTSTVKGKGPDSLSMTSGNTYRIKLDGSRIEPFTRGQVNPFGLAFDPLGNLFSADCHTRPLYQLLKGAHYPSFGRPHDGLGFGPGMVNHDHGSTAIAGVASSSDDIYPEEFRDNLFVGNVVTNRINRDRLERHGSTLRGIEMPDLVKCDDPWFRPVDIKLGPDGALYVADFYNRIIGHYEVPLDHPLRDREKGRIWRIVPVDQDGKPRLRPVLNVPKATNQELIAALGHPNLTVRLEATHELAARGPAIDAEVAEAIDKGSAYQRAHALWVLERIGAGKEGLLGPLCRDESPLVRVHAQRVLGERGEWNGLLRALAKTGLDDPDAFVQRAAVQGLGAHPHPDNLAPLLSLRQRVPAKDTHLLHAVRMALRDQFRDAVTAEAIVTRTWSETDATALADVTPGVGAESAARFLARHLATRPQELATRKDFAHTLVRHGTVEHRALVLKAVRNDLKGDLNAQAGLLKTVQQALQERGETLPAGEVTLAADVTRRLLGARASNEVQSGIELAQAMKLSDAVDPLLKLLSASSLPVAQRKNAIQALVSIDADRSRGALSRILLEEKEDITVREQVAQSLAGLNQPRAHDILVQALATAPARLQTAIALGMAGSAPGGERLLEAVTAGKASPRLLQDRAVTLRLQVAKIARLEDRLASLTRGLPAADQRLQDLLTKKRADVLASQADARRGQAVFQKHCATCHQVANQGAKIGPQLDGLGIRGLDRVLEDVIDPNRNVDQAFRSTTLALDNGQFLTGLVLREEGQVIVMADAQGKEVRVSKSNVQERTVGPLSPMPANLVEQIPDADFRDLIAFLLQQRPKP